MMRNFTFVTHKGGRPEKSELVKSHVMREAQRKRREDKQRRPTIVRGLSYQAPPPTSCISEAAWNSADSIGPSTLPFHSKAADSRANGSPDLMTKWQSPVSYSTWPTSPLPLLDYFNISQEKCTPAVLPGSPAGYSLGQTQEEFSDDLDELMDQNSGLNLMRQPLSFYETFVGQTTLDLRTIRDLHARMVEVTLHYGDTFLVQRAGHPPVNPCIYWQHASPGKPTVLMSCALFHCAYRDVVTDDSSEHHDYYKAKTIQLINTAMSHTDTAVSDDNISAVLGVCMYENLRGGDLLMTHLKGLRQMVDMRGGINNLPADQGQYFSEVIILQDLVHATCSNTPPFLIDIYGPVLRDVQSIGTEYFYPQSPLRLVHDAGFDRLDPQLQPISQVLKDAFDGFEMLCIETFDPITAAKEAEAFRTRRDACLERLRQSGDQGTDDGAPHAMQRRIQEAVRLAAIIHHRAVAFGILHGDESNAEDMQKLHFILRKIDKQSWKIAPYTYLWIQLTGGAASHNRPDYRPYFASEIMRLGTSVGLFDWRPFRQTVGNFLWLQQYLRRSKVRPIDTANSILPPNWDDPLAILMDAPFSTR